MRAGVLGALLVTFAMPAVAIPLQEPAPRYHWECVPFARAVSGIQIYGDAHTWWDQADGRYKRGDRPRIGAVLAFVPHGNMRLGHVATVSELIDRRTIKITHANWSRIDGRRGQVERDVEVRDVSEANDWSQVRVWYDPIEGLGTTAWPVHGFIYPDAAPRFGPAGEVRPPRLEYANLITLKASRPEQPTGRLAYLGKMLPKLD